MIKIADFEIGNDRTMIIAELSANHGHDIEIAKETIRAAKRAGADAIKLQTYTPNTLTINCDAPDFLIDKGTLWDGRTLYELYSEAFLPWEWHKELFDIAKEEGLICFSSPFDKTSVDFLEKLSVPAYKIASFEIQDIPLIEYVASKGKPIIISTGIAEAQDIELALDTCRKVGNNQIILLKCTSSYPAPIDLANMNTLVDFKSKFGVEVGLSDHTEGDMVPIVATSIGATVIEKHFILNKSIGGPDADFSLDENEFKKLVSSVRDVEKILGKVSYEVPEKVKSNRKFARSLYVVENIKKGEVLSEDNIRSIRPGYGLHPKHLKDFLGRKAVIDISKGTRLDWNVINL